MSRAPIAAVVPAFRCAGTIGAVVVGLRAAGLEPVLVVDDGSDDATADAAERAGATVLRHQANRGKGAALATGFAAALRSGAAAVLTADGDGQHDPADAPALLSAARREPEALVLGVRRLDPSAMPRRSLIGNRVSTGFLSCFLRRALADTQSGFRVYPRRLLEEAPLASRRFEAESELLIEALQRGLPLREVPIQTLYREGGESHFRDWIDTLRIIARVVALRPWRRPG